MKRDATGRSRGLIGDAVCSCGGPIGAECCEYCLPGTRCPVGVCMSCGRTWRRSAQPPLVSASAGSRDFEAHPDLTSLRDRATP